MTADVGLIIAQYLSDEVPDLHAGINVFKGPARPVPAPAPDTAVFVLASGGPEPMAFVGDDGLEELITNVQIRVRFQGEYSRGDTLSRQIRDAVQRYPVVPEIFDVRLINSAPIYLGLDDDSSSFEWSINLTVTEFTRP